MTQKHIVSFSGGKDSTAMLLRMIELNMPIDEIVFADTGFEFPELYDYIKRIEEYIKRPIKILKPNKDFDKWMNGGITRGKLEGQPRGFPTRLFPCWWSREAKIVPLMKNGKGNPMYVGIAYDEKERMSSTDDNLRYPLVDWKWTEQDCINYLNKKGIFNPLYVNFNRLGCYFCPKQNKSALYVLWKNYPELWSKTKEYEKRNIQLGCGLIFAKSTEELEKEFEKGQPKGQPKYECWSGCEAVKKAFIEHQKDLNSFCMKLEAKP